MDLELALKQSKMAHGWNDDQLSDATATIGGAFDTLALLPEPIEADRRQMGRLAEAMRECRAQIEAREAAARSRSGRMAALVASVSPRGAVGGMVGRMAARSGRATPSPTHRRPLPGPAVTITASMAARGIAPGQALGDAWDLAEVTSETLRRIQRDPTNFGRSHVVASARWDDAYPDDRRLDDSQERNTAKLDAVCGFGAPRVDHTGALVASGGICLPVNVDYSVPTWVTPDRPMRDGLPAFQASRGGIRFVAPPDIGVSSLQGAASGAGLATGVWTEATDANPSGATKPVWQVACGTEQLVYVNAITTRVEFGNMQSRFAPEQVAANTEVAIATAAREAELELLTLMYQSSKQVNPRQYLGAARDLLATVDLLIAQYRHSHRVPRTASFTAVVPEWARDLIRADLVREMAHDNSAPGRDSLGVSDAQIDDWFAVRGINVVWTLDGRRAGTYGTGGQALANQFFALATAGAEPQWPNQAADGTVQVGWLLFPEGTFQPLDGGRLDLGVVRDSVLDATNDYETFVEVFEGVAFRGLEAYQVQSVVQPTGASAATVAGAGYHE